MFTIYWKPLAENQLAQMWLDNPTRRKHLTQVVAEIDADLRNAPWTKGESRTGTTRILIRDFLVVYFDVVQDDRKVEVLAVRIIQSN